MFRTMRSLTTLLLALTAAGPTAPVAAAHAPFPQDAAAPEAQPSLTARWSTEPVAPFVGQPFDVVLTIDLDAGWAQESLVQLFAQELDVPLQVEAFGPPSGTALSWAGPLEAAEAGPRSATLVVGAARVRAARSQPTPDVLRLELVRPATATRAGSVTLPPARITYHSATSFRDDFVRGRVPEDTAVGLAEGTPLTVDVRELPAEGRPPAFDGAIGTFGLELEGLPRAVRATVPFAVDVVVRGGADLPQSVEPRVERGGLAPIALRREARAADVDARYRVEFVTEDPGDATVPAFSLVTFDPEAGAYVTLTTERRDVEVLPPPRQPRTDDAASPGEAAAAGNDADAAAASRLPWTLGVLGFVLLLGIASVVRRRLGGAGRLRGPLADAHVVLFGQGPLDARTGNAVALQRLLRGLRARGIRCSHVGPGDDPAALDVPPTLCHAFHAGGAATRAAEVAERRGTPLVVTTAGTDFAVAGPDVEANLERADAIVTLSDAQLTALGARGGAGLHIPRGIDAELFAHAATHANPEALRERFGWPSDVRIAVMLGGLRPVKDHALALEAFAILAGRRDPAAQRWRLAIIGDADDAEYAAALRERIESLDNVALHASVPHGEALVALASADALVNTSRGAGERRTLLEAQAVGTAAVARRTPGNETLIEDGRDGRLFDDARGLADALEAWVADPALAGQHRTGGRARVAERHSAEDEIDSYVALYARLLGEGTA